MKIRVIAEIEDCGETQGTKEAVAMALEKLGGVRVVAVEKVKSRENEQMRLEDRR